MSTFANFVRLFDSYASPMQSNFEDGQVAFNDQGHCAPRMHSNTLGQAIQKLKTKMTIRLRQKISRFPDFEGGEEEEGLRESLKVGYTPETFMGGFLSLLVYVGLGIYFVNRVQALFEGGNYYDLKTQELQSSRK